MIFPPTIVSTTDEVEVSIDKPREGELSLEVNDLRARFHKGANLVMGTGHPDPIPLNDEAPDEGTASVLCPEGSVQEGEHERGRKARGAISERLPGRPLGHSRVPPAGHRPRDVDP